MIYLGFGDDKICESGVAGEGARSSVEGNGNVVDFIAAEALEVGVRIDAGIEAGILVVNSEYQDGFVLLEQFQRIVHCSAREGGHARAKGSENLLHGRVGAVLHQVVHDGYPLLGEMYPFAV